MSGGEGVQVCVRRLEEGREVCWTLKSARPEDLQRWTRNLHAAVADHKRYVGLLGNINVHRGKYTKNSDFC